MRLSVIIPTLNEANFITETIRRVQMSVPDAIEEIIVIDAGSDDETVALAQAAGARVIPSSRQNRAFQMNKGAEYASGDTFYFLHADSLPPVNFVADITDALRHGFQAGCFPLQFDQDNWLLHAYAWFTHFDIDAFRFGDQSLFIKGETFFELGGFRERHLVMEDNELVRRIKEHYNFVVLENRITSSSRRYQKVGTAQLQFIFVLIYFLYLAGVSQSTLKHMHQELAG